MKYLEFWEYRPEDGGKVIDKTVKLEELRKNPGKYPESLFPSHVSLGKRRGSPLLKLHQSR